MKLKMSKCNFAKGELNFLGYTIGRKGIAPDPEKVQAIREIAPPRTIRQVRSFIGTMSYYRRFIKNFSQKAEPLIALTRKNVKFSWSSECHASFQQLKEDLAKLTVLAYPDITKPMIL